MNHTIPGDLVERINLLADDADFRARLHSLVQKAFADGYDKGYDAGCYEACASTSEIEDGVD